MKSITALFFLVLLLSAAPAMAGEPRDLVSTAASDARLRTLVSAVQRAGLVQALQGAGPFTVFAPTDEAFAALPPGALEELLRDPDALARVLRYHVVPGRVLAQDLLPTPAVKTLDGGTLALGLRVGKANVIEADLLCTNGVIHAIDRVLLPTLDSAASQSVAQGTAPMSKTQETPLDATQTIHAAIDRGAPLFNDGHIDQCASVYHEAASALVASDGALSAWDRMQLHAAVQKPAAATREQAWTLRRAFDDILANLSFKPRMEASLPKGFPEPGPVGHVIVKRYPQYRAARAEGGPMAFWTLFQHIKQNKVEMTAPVEMTMDGAMRARDMAFLYERPDQGSAGKQGRVDVLDLEPLTVISIGMRGARTAADMETAKQLLEARMAAEGWQRAGAFRTLGYNSPMVPAAEQYWEFQVPVRR